MTLMKSSLNLFFLFIYSFLSLFFALHLFPHIAEMSPSVISGGTEGGSVNHAAYSGRAISDAKSKLMEANLFISIADVTAFMSFTGRGEQEMFFFPPAKRLVKSTSLLVSPQRRLRRTVKMLPPPPPPTRPQTPPRCCSTAGATTWALRVGVLPSRSSVTMVTIATLVTASPSPGRFQICDQTGPS